MPSILQYNASFSFYYRLLTFVGLAFVFHLNLLGCDSTEIGSASAPQVPQLRVDQVHRGAFLGVWGTEEQGTEKIWFVGGEVKSATETHSLIASYSSVLNQEEDRGVLKLEHEQLGGVLWWVWGSRSGQIWAAGEQGTLLTAQQSQGASSWSQESLILEDDLKEKLVIWGIWGTEASLANGEEFTQVWAVGGSVRRGGPKGVLLKRNRQGEWLRIQNDLLPVESATDPLQGGNLYKIWGNKTELWIVGEGSLTLKANLQVNESGVNLVDWETISLDSERPELLFTVTGLSNEERSEDNQAPWLVGGYAQGRAWHWQDRQWTELQLPQVPSLNGVALGQDFVLASGHQGLLMAWPHDISEGQDSRIHQQWVQGAESMTLHSIWHSTQGEFWIVGGDLTTMQSGVIITPLTWQGLTSNLEIQAW